MSFYLGRTVITANMAARCLEENISNGELMFALTMFKNGEWGDLCKEDKRVNDAAVLSGDRLLGAYRMFGLRFWIITEGDRSSTTFLLPEDY